MQKRVKTEKAALLQQQTYGTAAFDCFSQKSAVKVLGNDLEFYSHKLILYNVAENDWCTVTGWTKQKHLNNEFLEE